MDEDSLLNRPLVRVVRALALAGHFLLAPAVLTSAFILLRIAETPQGRLMGAGAFLLYTGSLVLWLWFIENIRRLMGIALAFLFGLGGAAVIAAFIMRPASPPPGGNFTEHFSGDAHRSPTSLSNLVPEIDQLKLGTYVMDKLDARLAASGTERLRALMLNIYGEMDRDPAFGNSGSALGFCYDDIIFGQRDLLHFYEYVPRQLHQQNYPVLIFLHGSLGNFKGYTWVLKRFADQTGIAIIAPTFGVGDWRKDRHGKVMESVLKYCSTQPELDSSRLYLGGLSNGGMGVSREILRGGPAWRGLVLLSPVLEDQIVGDSSFVQHAKGLPILIIHGESDDRIPVAAIKQLAGTIRGNGAIVTEQYYPGEDHFLVFSQPDAIVKNMVDWVTATNEKPAAAPPKP